MYFYALNPWLKSLNALFPIEKPFNSILWKWILTPTISTKLLYSHFFICQGPHW